MTDDKLNKEGLVSQADALIIRQGDVYDSSFRITFDVIRNKQSGEWDIILINSHKLVEDV